MAWEDSVLALFADLELQAEGLHLEERRAEVAALGAAHYAEITLDSRILGSVGEAVTVRLRGGLAVRGRLTRAAADWALLEDEHGRAWLLPQSGIATVAGLSDRSVGEEARTVLAKLRIGSVLRSLAGVGHECVLHLVDGTRVEGRLGRVGRDFVEVHPGPLAGASSGPRSGPLSGPGREVVPLGALAAVQERR